MDKFTKNTTITFVTRVLTLIAGLATSVIIARLLGPEGKGIYALAILLPSLITAFTNLGIGSATVYYIGRGKYPHKEVFGNNVVMSLTLGVFSMAIGLVIIYFFRDPVFSGISRRYLLLTLAVIPSNLFFSYTTNVLLGLQRIKEYNLAAIAQTASFLGLIAITLWGLSAGITGAILAGIMANLLVNLLLFFWIKRITSGISFQLNRNYIKDISLYGIKAHSSNLLSFLHLRLDILLIGAFMNPLVVGYYSIAVGVTEKLWLLSQSTSTVLFPKVASEKDEKRRKEFTPIVSRNVLFITALGALVIFFFSRWIIVLLFSEAYLPAVRPLQILLIGTVAVSVSRVLGNDFAGRGQPMLNTYLNIIATGVNLSLNILWIPRFGIDGAAWATTVSYSIAMTCALLVYSKVSGNPWAKVLLPQRTDWALYRRTGLALGQWVKAKVRAVL